MRQRHAGLISCLILAAAVAACGTSVRKQQAQRLAEADALFARACYTCLSKAFASYDALRLAGYQPAAMTARAFDTALLLAAREKDLAMEATAWIARARALAPRHARAQAQLEIVDALPWGLGRHDEDFTHAGLEAAGPVLDALERWDAALSGTPGSSLTSVALLAEARCALTPALLRERLTIEVLAPAYRHTPLMRYIAGKCRAELGAELEYLGGDADFHEAAFHMARQRLFEGGTTVRLAVRELLEAVRTEMPGLVANAWLLAGVLDTLEEYEPCAAMYREVIGLGGAARASRLNRTVCLTHASRYRDAVASASELIDTPGILRGEAFFWRATNHYHLTDRPAARADVEAAKPLYDDAAVYALSGFIAYDMGQKEYAYTEFGEAFTRNRGYCTAPFYQGLIDAERERWEPAAALYAAATGCYEMSVRRLRFSLEQAEALDAEDPARQRRLDTLRKALDGERLQTAHAAYNVAYANGRLGRAAAGIPFAEKAAAAHKDMEKLATDLLAILRKAG